MFARLNQPQQVAGVLFGLLAVFAVSYLGAQSLRRPAAVEFRSAENAPSTPVNSLLSAPPASAPPATARVVVHVAGAVNRPGLYEFAPGSRVNDALKAAGGAAKDASLDDINLAAKLVDGDQLHVPRKAKDGSVDTSKVAQAYAGGESAGGAYRTKPAKSASGKDPAPGSISLNNAGASELDRLPGVGPSTAAKILAYRREHGGFASIDELLSVKGIGPKKLAAMRKFLRL